MFRGSSPFDYSSSYADSLQSTGTAVDETSSELSGLSRPSAKSIYLQRKDYAESINRQLHQCEHRVEHLFTCELDGRQVCSVQDCVERLKFLDATGRVWGQDVILEARNGALLLRDIETKEELESWPLSSVLDLKAVLDDSVYDSLLTVSVQERSSGGISVFLFQSESLRADYLKKDLDRLLRQKTHDDKQSNVSKAGLGNIMQRNSRTASPPPERREMILQKPPEQWSAPDYDESPVLTPPISRNTSTYIRMESPTPPPPVEGMPRQQAPPPQRRYTEKDRDVDILNHLINDIEAFVEKLTAVAPKIDKKKKRRKQKAVRGMPSDAEFTVCLQKVKMAFNLLAKLQGKIDNPGSAELTHCLFSILELIVFHCSEDLPQSVVAPLLEPECIVFLSETASPEEDKLWQSLGDPWNIPSTKWPEDDDFIPSFTPVFEDGWKPPEIRDSEPIVTHTPVRQTVTAQPSIRSSQESQQRSEEEVPIGYMRAIFDFTARNGRELTISKGEELQLLDMSKQWWKVRNQEGKVGYVPNNMLQSPDQQEKSEAASVPALSRRSRPEEVRAWLELQGFSRITIRCLGGLSGSMLLGMTRDELKTVCPEEGGRVFYQLQKIKSSLTMSSEVTPMI